MNNTLPILWLIFNGLLLFIWMGICCLFTGPYIKKHKRKPTRFFLWIFVEAVADYFIARQIAKERKENPLALRIHGYLTYYFLAVMALALIVGCVVIIYQSFALG